MITEALLSLLSWVMREVGERLPLDELEIDEALDAFGGWIGQFSGPFDRFFPIHEATQFLVIFFGVWCPAVVVYTVAKWIYKHIPVFGNG